MNALLCYALPCYNYYISFYHSMLLSVLCYTAPSNARLQTGCAVLHRQLLCYAALYCSASEYAVLHYWILLHCNTFYYAVWCYILLHYITLYLAACHFQVCCSILKYVIIYRTILYVVVEYYIVIYCCYDAFKCTRRYTIIVTYARVKPYFFVVY